MTGRTVVLGAGLVFTTCAVTTAAVVSSVPTGGGHGYAIGGLPVPTGPRQVPAPTAGPLAGPGTPTPGSATPGTAAPGTGAPGTATPGTGASDAGAAGGAAGAGAGTGTAAPGQAAPGQAGPGLAGTGPVGQTSTQGVTGLTAGPSRATTVLAAALPAAPVPATAAPGAAPAPGGGSGAGGVSIQVASAVERPDAAPRHPAAVRPGRRLARDLRADQDLAVD